MASTSPARAFLVLWSKHDQHPQVLTKYSQAVSVAGAADADAAVVAAMAAGAAQDFRDWDVSPPLASIKEAHRIGDPGLRGPDIIEFHELVKMWPAGGTTATLSMKRLVHLAGAMAGEIPMLRAQLDTLVSTMSADDTRLPAARKALAGMPLDGSVALIRLVDVSFRLQGTALLKGTVIVKRTWDAHAQPADQLAYIRDTARAASAFNMTLAQYHAPTAVRMAQLVDEENAALAGGAGGAPAAPADGAAAG
jgi:hypothetical protein